MKANILTGLHCWWKLDVVDCLVLKGFCVSNPTYFVRPRGYRYRISDTKQNLHYEGKEQPVFLVVVCLNVLWFVWGETSILLAPNLRENPRKQLLQLEEFTWAEWNDSTISQMDVDISNVYGEISPSPCKSHQKPNQMQLPMGQVFGALFGIF